MERKTPFDLTGKNIIVTGASSGIGRQCAISCSQMGASLMIFGRNKERLAETLSLMANQARHLVYSLDLLEYDKVEELLKEALMQNGKINGLVNCAGISTTLPFKMLTTKKLDEFFYTNVYSAINLTKIVTKQAYMYEEGGSIVFISSVMGIVGEVGKTLYSMTKGALLSGSRSLALELANRKIRVNCVSPGVVESPMSKNAVYNQDEASLDRVKSYHPLGLGQTHDVANACVFLLSDAARWITGSNLFVDGGYTAR